MINSYNKLYIMEKIVLNVMKINFFIIKLFLEIIEFVRFFLDDL